MQNQTPRPDKWKLDVFRSRDKFGEKYKVQIANSTRFFKSNKRELDSVRFQTNNFLLTKSAAAGKHRQASIMPKQPDSLVRAHARHHWVQLFAERDKLEYLGFGYGRRPKTSKILNDAFCIMIIHKNGIFGAKVWYGGHDFNFLTGNFTCESNPVASVSGITDYKEIGR